MIRVTGKKENGKMVKEKNGTKMVLLKRKRKNMHLIEMNQWLLN